MNDVIRPARTGSSWRRSGAHGRDDDPGTPVELGEDEVPPGLQVGHQPFDLGGVVVGPTVLLQHVVDDVETTGLEEPQGFVEVAELANPGIREDEIELRRRQPADEDGGVLEVEVHFVAESALSEAVQRLNAVGVVDFQNDVVGRWPSTWGPVKHGFAPLPGYTYTVTPVPSAADPAGAGQLVATADGPEGEHNVAVANVMRSNIPSAAPGAIYLATDATTNTVFHGGILAVTGSDHDCAGGPGSGSPVPGISTRNATNTQNAINSLDTDQKYTVQGLGFSSLPPVTPSVSTSAAPPASRRWASSSTISWG